MASTSFQRANSVFSVNSPGVVGKPTNGGGSGEPGKNPLKLFVDAKKKINETFTGVKGYIAESHMFIQECINLDNDVSNNHKLEELSGYLEKATGISDVLTRDHMKVAFFGRTSNGKSTVINAMLRDKILPTGIGHTTSCFLSVEGCDNAEAYLMTPGSDERKNVKSVAQLAHALCGQKLEPSSNVQIFWPKSRCALLKYDVVFVDSPGVDVTPDLDSWIDQHCMDADVFVLVGNAESTLMRAEKNFFHKVSEKLSKPNIFILNNRWEAAATDDHADDVRAQHEERNTSFLVDELRVVELGQVNDRIFFVSAKEMLNMRLQQQQGMPEEGGALAPGSNARKFEFENFEHKFQECLSQSAIKTKFEQHCKKGQELTTAIQATMDDIFNLTVERKSECEDRLATCSDMLGKMTTDQKSLAYECKENIKDVVEDVEAKVSNAMMEEINRLSVLVNEFNKPFHPDRIFLKVYKDELHGHLEEGLGRNLQARCSTALTQSLEITKKEMISRMETMLPPNWRVQHQQTFPSMLRHDFDLSYKLDCRTLCRDFEQNLDFQFSLGIRAVMSRFMGMRKKQFSLMSLDSLTSPVGALHPALSPVATSSGQEVVDKSSEDELLLSLVAGVASLTSRTSMGVLVITGIVWRTVGWRLLALCGAVYSGVYIYERLTWTNKAKEKTFKRQFVRYARDKLQLVVSYTSSNCSQQVQHELSTTFSQLCLESDRAIEEIRVEINDLKRKMTVYSTLQGKSKTLRNQAYWLTSELKTFALDYLTV